MLESLIHCHDRNIVHHDVKLENMVLGKDQCVRLSDFGLSVKRNSFESITTYGGSPLYMAPEIMSRQPHNERVDVWSLGVCLYVMVSGTFPFVADSYELLVERVLFDDVPYLFAASDELNNLLRGMLQKDSGTRVSLTSVRQHPWVVGEARPSSTW